MKLSFFWLLSIFVVFQSCSQKVKEQQTTTSYYYLIRHAEKDRSDIHDQDPHLNETGLKRAQKWAKTFENISFDAIYSTDYNRTRETVHPISEQKQLAIKIYDPENFDLTNFLKSTSGKTVLIVGHSNTIPGLVNKIIDQEKYDQIEDSNNSNLYIINGQEGDLYDSLLVIE